MSLFIATQREIAQRLGLSVGTVRKLVRAKLLPAHLVRGVYVLAPAQAALSVADLFAAAMQHGTPLASPSNPHATPAGTVLAEVSAHSAAVAPQHGTPLASVSTHSPRGERPLTDPPGGGVCIETSAPGLSTARIKNHRDKYGYVVDIKRKKGTGPKRVIRLRGEGEGPKGGRGRKDRELHPVIQEMLDGTL